MTPAAALLVTISAFGHATWNLLGKRSSPTPVFFFLANSWGALILLPYIWWQQALNILAGSWTDISNSLVLCHHAS